MGLGLGLNLSAGYVPSWEPSELSSLLHWYRLGVGQDSDANGATAWNDQKGSNNLSGSGGSGAQPIITNGAIVFNSNSDHLEFSSALVLGKFSIYIRAEHSTPGDFFLVQTSSGGTDFAKMQTNSEARVKITSRHDYELESALSNDIKYTAGFERDADGDIKVFVNSEQATLVSGDGNVAISDTTNITELGRPSVGLTVHELVILNDALDATNRALLFNYLSSK